MASEKQYVTEYKKITLKTADGSTIQGSVNIGIKERVSDLFTIDESPFIVLVNAMMREGDAKIMFVNKDHIVWVEPEENEEI